MAPRRLYGRPCPPAPVALTTAAAPRTVSARLLAAAARPVTPAARALTAAARPVTPAARALTHAARALTPTGGPALPPRTAEKTLRAGDSEVYDFDGITTTAVGDPAVADIVPVSTGRLLVNAKRPGRTTIFVFDRRGKNVLHLTVVAAPSELASVAVQVERQIGDPGVAVRVVSDTLFLEGNIATAAASQRAEAIAGAYAVKVKNLLLVGQPKEAQTLAQTYAALLTDSLSATGIAVKIIDEHTLALSGKYAAPIAPPPRNLSDARDDGGALSTAALTRRDPLDRLLTSLPAELKVVNLINFQSRAPQQILVRAKIIDIDRSASKNLGINWGGVNYTTSNGTLTGTFSPQPILFSQLPGGFFRNQLGGGGPLTRFLPYAAQLNALITEGKARLLSEPSLVVLDGNEGSMLVGGEIPIPVAQNSNGTGGATITVEYKQFGVRLNVTPTIVSDNTIQLTVTPEVSNLDFANAVQFNGFKIPALGVRRATSTLQMQDGQTLVIGGLYSNDYNKQVQRIPLLSQIPVLGEFFKNTVTTKDERELLILLEPEIVKPATAGVQPPPPGSLENPGIGKPDLSRHIFDQDFPELEKIALPDRAAADQRGKPERPVNLPPAPTP